MIRKTLIAIAAAATMAVGLGAATAPAEAGHRRPHFGIYFGTPSYGYNHRRAAPYHCHIRKVWRNGHRARVRRCHRAWH
jgi:hypothetical protein